MSETGCRWIVRLCCVASAGALLYMLARSCHSQGWGCFVQDEKLGEWSPANWRAHCTLMRRAGMNTLTLSYPSDERLTQMVDIAIDSGMLDASIPVLVLPRCGEAEARRVLGDQRVSEIQADFTERGLLLGGWAPGEAGMAAALWECARSKSRYSYRWPEPIGYGPDEPRDEATECHERDCGERLNVWPVTRMWHAAGWRHGTAVMHPHIRCLTRALDVVVANLIIGADPTIEEQRRECERLGREFWVYEIQSRYARPDMIRWQVGWNFWQTRARVHLSWSWADFLEDPEAPTWNERLAGFAAGVRDYRRLERLSDRAQTRRRALWDGEGWPVREWIEARDKTGDANRNAEPDFDFRRLLPEARD